MIKTNAENICCSESTFGLHYFFDLHSHASFSDEEAATKNWMKCCNLCSSSFLGILLKIVHGRKHCAEKNIYW